MLILRQCCEVLELCTYTPDFPFCIYLASGASCVYRSPTVWKCYFDLQGVVTFGRKNNILLIMNAFVIILCKQLRKAEGISATVNLQLAHGKQYHHTYRALSLINKKVNLATADALVFRGFSAGGLGYISMT